MTPKALLLMTPLLAAPAFRLADPCECVLDAETTICGTFPPSCTPTSFVVTVDQYNTSHDGWCDVNPCQHPANCYVEGNIRVQTDSPCRIRFYKDASYVGGGVGDADVGVDESLECGDFVIFEVNVGMACILTKDWWCKPCAQGGG